MAECLPDAAAWKMEAFVVVAFLWVSTKHKESGLGDTCSGNCSSCRAHCKDEAKIAGSSDKDGKNS